MRELNLSPNSTDVTEDQRRYIEEISRIRKKPKVYSTYWTTEGLDFALVTTSKDLHLKMGQHSARAINHLCRLLNYEFSELRDDRCGPLVITFTFETEGESGDDKAGPGLLITLAERHLRSRVFHLAVAG